MAGDEQPNDPHDWNGVENYVFLHRMRLERHPLVPAGADLSYRPLSTPMQPHDQFAVEGILNLKNGVTLEVKKSGVFDRATRRVRMDRYLYAAYLPGDASLLRYDNAHGTDGYHKHVFDPATNRETAKVDLARHEFPVMHEVLDEIERLRPL